MEQREREILRYLGYKQKDLPDERTRVLISETEEELKRVCTPARVFRIFPIREVTEELVDFGFTSIRSRNLARNLSGCFEAVFLAATLGSKTEQLLAKYNRLQVSRAVVLQAAATQAIEEYCDACEEEIRGQLGAGCYMRPRFSPGYGDFSLEFQREMLQILETPKKIGLTLTGSLLMMPSKSVTAVIGISREVISCSRRGCEACDRQNCPYRRG
ncbi:MAG: vitamin B12 dependent-methionine synthase activation domain-containing protein [Lachnospiraceae bacterium]|nr:vitamin B12 dependent-methionine synthase activation domain-containing protein [Lachnospiraceae bacterium]